MVGLTGAVLAGGHSSRFGSNKALYSLTNGKTLLQVSIDLLRTYCEEVLISTSEENARAYEAYQQVGIVTDNYTDCGPLGGVEAILEACKHPWALILTCDMPAMDAETLSLQLSSIRGKDANAIAWQTANHRLMPFPLLIRKDTLPIVREKLQAGCLKMKDLLNALDTKWIIITDEGPFKNINRTDDLLR